MPINENLPMELLRGLRRETQSLPEMMSTFQQAQQLGGQLQLQQNLPQLLAGGEINKPQILSQLAGVDPQAALKLSGLFTPETAGMSEYQAGRLALAQEKSQRLRDAEIFYNQVFLPAFTEAMIDQKIDENEALRLNQMYAQYKAAGGLGKNPLKDYYQQMERKSKAEMQKITTKEKTQQMKMREGDLYQDVNNAIRSYAKSAGSENTFKGLWFYDHVNNLYSQALAGNPAAQNQFITAIVKMGDPNSAVLIEEAHNVAGKGLGMDVGRFKNYLQSEAPFEPKHIKRMKIAADELFKTSKNRYGEVLSGTTTSINDILRASGKKEYTQKDVLTRLGVTLPKQKIGKVDLTPKGPGYVAQPTKPPPSAKPKRVRKVVNF